MIRLKNIYQKTVEEIFKDYNTSSKGLKGKQLKGKNVLVEQKKMTKLQIFLKQFKNVMIILLLVVGVLSLVYSIISKSDYIEPIVILGTTILNCVMGFLQESKAEDATQKLKKYSTDYVIVKRNNKFKLFSGSLFRWKGEMNTQAKIEGQECLEIFNFVIN